MCSVLIHGDTMMLAARAVTVILRSSVLNPLDVTVARLCCSDSQLKVAPFAHFFFFRRFHTDLFARSDLISGKPTELAR